jgi:NADH-quinone oxidoreductase subunit F
MKKPAAAKQTAGEGRETGMEQPLTEHIKPGEEPAGLKEYRQMGGYRALHTALKDLAPPDLIQVVKDSGLTGRGGAGFPTGRKWSFIPNKEDSPGARYFIANADEMEPGTFKDRLLLEGNPHQLIEGIILGAYAVQANEAYIFLRWAYKTAARRLEKAISELYEAGYLGKNILGSGYDLNLRLHTSAGRYICGEATALLNALEGQRAIPRSKPPHAAASGLWARPTVVNNVETLCNVPHIVNNGADWFKSLSLSGESGTKIFQVSGKVKRAGAWELPMGTTIREIVEGKAGGMRDGLALKGLLPGGASTEFLLPKHMDVKMDSDSVQQAGSRLGTGTIIILDDQTCPVGMVGNLMQFFAQESCGWCTPCRDGLPWTAKILQAMEAGQGQPGDVERLALHTELISDKNTFCELATGAMEPLRSALELFGDDFERHIREKRCPWSR